MNTPIYDLLMFHNPQALIDLDSYQRRCYDCGINPPAAPFQPPVTLNVKLETTEEIGREMSRPPASPASLKEDA